MERPPVRRLDVLAPAGLAVLCVLELVALDATGRLPAGAVLVLACAVLVPRRRWPLLCAPAAVGLTSVIPWFGPRINDVASPILLIALASYSLGRWVADLRGLTGLGLALGFFGFEYLTIDTRQHDITDIVFLLALLTPPYVFGRLARRLADYNAVLERERQLVREAAVRDERERIARELHDVMAHSVGAMVVQVAVAQDLLRADPGGAADLLESAVGTGRRALAETGRLLHTIRDGRDELGLAPAPGVADLPELVEQHRRSGLRVDVRLPDPLPVLPAAVDVSVHRVVAEALTNAGRYAADGAVDLVLDDRDGRLVVTAANATTGATGRGAGLGLTGMAERVALLGGQLAWVSDGGRFVLEVELPVQTVTGAEETV